MAQHYMGYSKHYAAFWESCGNKFAHTRGPNAVPRLDENLLKRFVKWYGFSDTEVSYEAIKDSVVVDYGIGNGRLAVPMLNLGAKRYIGIDVAQRQLEEARQFLSEQGYEDNITLLKTPVEFNKLAADVFITEGCMQHFPNEHYLVDFLNNLNKSNIKCLLLQYRYTKKRKEFNPNIPVWACKVQFKYIESILSHYTLEYVSGCDKHDYQFTRWQKEEDMMVL